MCEDETTEQLKRKYLVLFRYLILNEAKALAEHPKWTRFVEIDIETMGDDLRTEYTTPKIREIYAGIVEVRVVDKKAVNLQDKETLLGDYQDALEKCEAALEEKGYTICWRR